MRHQDDIEEDAYLDFYSGNPQRLAHDNETIQARREGLIDNKGAAKAKAIKFTANGLRAVLLGSPRYSDLDAVMGYYWALTFVGNEAACNVYIDSLGDYDDMQVEVVR